jgi:hypothetical protein
VKIGKVIRDVFTLDVCINRIGQNMALNAPNCNASVEYKHMLGLQDFQGMYQEMYKDCIRIFKACIRKFKD